MIDAAVIRARIKTIWAMQVLHDLRRMFEITSLVTESAERLPERPLTMTGLRIQERNKQSKESS